MGSAQAGKGRNHKAAVGVFDLHGHVLRVGGGFNKPQLVPEPLDSGTGHEDGAFQRIADLTVQAPGNGGHQTVAGENGLVAGVHQQEGTGAVCNLGITGVETGLAEEGGLLVAGSAGNGNGGTEKQGIGYAVAAGRGHGLGQHGSGDVHEGKDLFIPGKGVDVKEHGPGGVGVVRHMDLTAGELPDQPGFHCAEEQLAVVRLFPGAGNVFQNPADLGAGEVGIDDQTGLAADGVHQSPGGEFVAVGGSPAALPDDGIVHRAAGELVPHDGGFSLIGDADGGDVRSGGTDIGQSLPGNLQLGRPDLVCVVLNPAGLGEDLGKFLLGYGTDLTGFVKQNAAVGGGAGIQGHDILCHNNPSFSSLVTEHGCDWRYALHNSNGSPCTGSSTGTQARDC